MSAEVRRSSTPDEASTPERRVGAVRGRDRDLAVGVVAVRVRDRAAGGRRVVGGDVEGARRCVARAVEGGDGLRPREVVERVDRLERGDRVVDAAREADLVDPGERVVRGRSDGVRAGLAALHVDRRAGHVGERARLGERERGGRRVGQVDADLRAGGLDGFGVADAVDREVLDRVDAVRRQVDARALRGARRRSGAVGRVVRRRNTRAAVDRAERDGHGRVPPCGADRARVIARRRRRRVRRDRERVGGGQPGAVVRRDRLRAGEGAEAVARPVRARGVVHRAGEADLLDPRLCIRARRVDVVASALAGVDEDRLPGDVGIGARLGERDGRSSRDARVDLDDVR